MKMVAQNFNALKADFAEVLSRFYFYTSPEKTATLTLSEAFVVFHEVCAQRSYDDTHPRWAKRDRVLSADYAAVWHGGQSGFLAHLYANDGSPLNDSHISTALRKILKSYTQ